MFLGIDHKVKKNICSICHHELSGATQINGIDKPKPGDVSLCIECGNIAIFCDDLQLRQATKEEILEILRDPETAIMQAIIFFAKKTH